VGTPIHRKTHKISGATEVFDDSFPIMPGAIRKNKIKAPNIFPMILCLSSKISFDGTTIDSFQEIFKYTNVITTTRAEAFNTISKGIGRSPIFTTP
jgi:hypothetical protein